MKINEGGFYGRMTKESFDGVKICSLSKKVRRKTMPERMYPPASFYTATTWATAFGTWLRTSSFKGRDGSLSNLRARTSPLISIHRERLSDC